VLEGLDLPAAAASGTPPAEAERVV
jgi:hypothetical protein